MMTLRQEMTPGNQILSRYSKYVITINELFNQWWYIFRDEYVRKRKKEIMHQRIKHTAVKRKYLFCGTSYAIVLFVW